MMTSSMAASSLRLSSSVRRPWSWGVDMDCWTCEKTALASCRFCGRGACRDHAQSRPFILSLYNARAAEIVRAVVVEDAVHCGVCTPRGEPVDLPELT